MGEADKETGNLAKMVALTAGEMKGRLVPNWCKLENMLTHFPKAVPEIPVKEVEKAAESLRKCTRVPFRLG